MAGPAGYDPQTIATGAEALLREHPDALVCALAGNGLIVPVPQSVGLWGQGADRGPRAVRQRRRRGPRHRGADCG